MKNYDTLSSIKFLFAKIAYEGYYYYCIDDLDAMNLIDKESLKNLLLKLKCLDFMKINYILDRNFPFFFDNSTKQLKELQNSTIDNNEIKNLLSEQLKIEIQKNSIFNNISCEKINLYQNELYKRLNLWQ